MSILECKGLSKRFGAVTALDGISFTIEPGRIVGLLGPNGSGKTTLIKLANGLLVPTAGELWINGRAPISWTWVYPMSFSRETARALVSPP